MIRRFYYLKWMLLFTNNDIITYRTPLRDTLSASFMHVCVFVFVVVAIVRVYVLHSMRVVFCGGDVVCPATRRPGRQAD